MRQRQASPTPHRPQELSLNRLFLPFLKLGATAFGGPAMLAYMRTVVVEQQHWLAEEPFRAGVALCQTIPGATAMQLAAYVGFRLRGVTGAAASFIGFGLPAFLLMLALSAFYVRASSLPTALAAFHGLRVIIVALVANATRSFGCTSLHTWRGRGYLAGGSIPFRSSCCRLFSGWCWLIGPLSSLWQVRQPGRHACHDRCSAL